MISRIGNTVLVVCAVILTSLVVRKELFVGAPVARRTAGEWREVRDWRSYSTSGERLGRSDAPVTIVVFGDFECPACRALTAVLHELLERRASDVSVRYRHMPLPIHRFAEAAALASACASRQGKFAEMYDSLYAGQRSFGLRSWTDFALAAGVADTGVFGRCTRDSSTANLIGEDRAAYERLGATGTPTLVAGSHAFTGVPTLRMLDSLVDSQLRASVADRRER